MIKICTIILLAILTNGCQANDENSNCDLSKAECKVPDDWGWGQVEIIYNNGDDEIADKVIKANGGYDDFQYFPISLNLLINKALNKKDYHYYNLANQIAILLNNKYSGTEYHDYLEIINYLRKNGERTNFQPNTSIACLDINHNYNEIYDVVISKQNRPYYEYSMWYGLYVNQGCSTANSRAIYIASLIELDAAKAMNEFRRIIELYGQDHTESVQFRGALCRFRDNYVLYTEKTGIFQFEKAGLIKCAKKLVDE